MGWTISLNLSYTKNTDEKYLNQWRKKKEFMIKSKGRGGKV